MHIVIPKATTKSNTKRYSLKTNKMEYFLKNLKSKAGNKGTEKELEKNRKRVEKWLL